MGWIGTELGQKAEKKNIYSNGQKEEASWIGGKAEKQNICSNRKKRREKQVGVTKQKKEELLQERNKITKIKISGGKSTWIL